MKRTVVPSLLLASLFLAGAAHAEETLTPSGDTYVKLDSRKGYGTATAITVKRAKGGDGDNTRKGVIRFENTAEDVTAASLLLDVDSLSDASSVTFYVWGVREGSGCGETFNEDTAGWNTFGFLDKSDDGVDNGSACLYDGNPAVSGAQALGTVTVTTSNVGKTIEFTNQNLVDFINSDRNGLVTVAITGATNNAAVTFASKEDTSRNPPRLVVERVGRVNIEDDPDALEGALSLDENGIVHMAPIGATPARLHIPLAGGKEIVFPAPAGLDMHFDSHGDLDWIQGIVGFPELPDMGLLGSMGEITGPSFTIGYASPDESEVLQGLPLTGTSRYFYLVEQSSAEMSWGPLSISPPVGSGSTVFAMAPNEPTVYFYSEQLFPDTPVGAIAFGVSGSNSLLFTPAHTWGVGAQMTSFGGDAYLGASIGFENQIPNVTATLTGDMTIDVKDGDFLAGNGSDWIENLGANVELSLDAELGGFALSYDVGGASVLYRRGGTPSITFSTEASSGIAGLPFMPNGNVRAAGYLSGDLASSFVRFDGKMKFPGLFTRQSFELSVLVNKDGGDISGKAEFAGTKVDIDGHVYPTYARFSGRADTKFDAWAGTIEAYVKTTFDTRLSDVGLGAGAKLCVKDPVFGGKECTGGSADAEVTSDGHLKVCAHIPGYGTKCQTL